tara:strand:- start:403 stop:564 length:162 start_codon:yes stop_codon:yes gene_type:complete
MTTLTQAIAQIKTLNQPTHVIWDFINGVDGKVTSDGTYVSQNDVDSFINNLKK